MSMVWCLFYFFIWSILIMESLGNPKKTDETIFVQDYCELKCGNITHTLCAIKNPKPDCDDFELHRFDLEKYADQLKLLIHGHNGIRNRIAERMHVPNMLEMAWDLRLARMAENFLYRCYDRITDPCTLMPTIFEEEETITEFFKFNISEKYIAQNTFHERSHFYPYKFLERVIRSWYFEKDGMREPTEVEGASSDEFPIKRLLGENNFTHFAYPFVNRFGCGMAKYKGGFHILCNYYPYYRTLTNTMYFQTGIPVDDCPARFPLRDEMFTNLCTDESDNYFASIEADDAPADKAGILKCFDLLSLSVLEVLVLYYFYY